MDQYGSRYRVVRCTLAAIAGGLTGAAFVHAHGGETERIHACVSGTSGAVRMVDPGDSCAISQGAEAPQDWNVTGPAGPTGAEGPRGVAGPEGAGGSTGPPGADNGFVLRHVSVTVGAAPDNTLHAVARCARGEFVTSGSFEVRFTDGGLAGPAAAEARESRPLTDGSGWVVTTHTVWTREAELEIFATCASPAPGT